MARPHGDGEIVIGAPTDLVVLACRSNALHCRWLEGSRTSTVRTAVRDEVPGVIITVVADFRRRIATLVTSRGKTVVVHESLEDRQFVLGVACYRPGSCAWKGSQ